MLDQNDGHPPVAHPADQRVEVLGLTDVHPRRRLVQQQQPWLHRQRPAELQQALLAIRQIRRHGVALAGEADEFEGLQRPAAHLGLLPRLAERAVQRRLQERPPERRVCAPVLAEHHVLEHGHVAEQADVLEGPGDPERRAPVRPEPPERSLQEADFPGIGRHHPGEQIEQRRLAGPVGADDRVYAPLPHRDIDIAQRMETAEPLGQADRPEARPAEGFRHCPTAAAGTGTAVWCSA